MAHTTKHSRKREQAVTTCTTLVLTLRSLDPHRTDQQGILPQDLESPVVLLSTHTFTRDHLPYSPSLHYPSVQLLNHGTPSWTEGYWKIAVHLLLAPCRKKHTHTKKNMAGCSVPTRTTKGGFLIKGRLSARTACSYKAILAEEQMSFSLHLPLHHPQRCPLSTW